MTCKEKYKEITKQDLENVEDYCPSDFGIMRNPEMDMCAYFECEKCWNREVPEIDVEKINKAMAAAVGIPEEMLNHPNPISPHILDSGDRTQFESGAVRDMREGKGRFDISPLEVMAELLTSKGSSYDPIVDNMGRFMCYQDTDFLLAALRIFADRAYGGCIPTMLLEVAIHFEQGAKKYGEANYRLGIPVKYYIDSAVRHYMKWLRGDNEEPHNRAFVWNVLCCIWEVKYADEWRTAMNNKEDQ